MVNGVVGGIGVNGCSMIVYVVGCQIWQILKTPKLPKLAFEHTWPLNKARKVFTPLNVCVLRILVIILAV